MKIQGNMLSSILKTVSCTTQHVSPAKLVEFHSTSTAVHLLL